MQEENYAKKEKPRMNVHLNLKEIHEFIDFKNANCVMNNKCAHH